MVSAPLCKPELRVWVEVGQCSGSLGVACWPAHTEDAAVWVSAASAGRFCPARNWIFFLKHNVRPIICRGFPGGPDSKESVCSAGDQGLIPGGEDPLEKGMASHSSVLACWIPWTEEQGRLKSLGSQRARHNWEANHSICRGEWYAGWQSGYMKINYPLSWKRKFNFMKWTTMVPSILAHLAFQMRAKIFCGINPQKQNYLVKLVYYCFNGYCSVTVHRCFSHLCMNYKFLRVCDLWVFLNVMFLLISN